eukprot:TRINITY_DN1031_c0_g1_i2.p1 TRINITY_DN1031_c0_g1~~TRINITY_DN1031_c0_g1_i2.p1  ORF type:complete len:2482 (+),score=739.97 TRINITY_DN1031_c0_g1_i2:3125-10570(+)
MKNHHSSLTQINIVPLGKQNLANQQRQTANRGSLAWLVITTRPGVFMNRQRYKLVFNRHRGQLMAVAEIASSIQHHGRTSAGATAMPDLLPSALRFSLLAVALALAMNTVAHAQILGDRNAPRNQQPTVLVTPNGVPVINIQTPSTAGVSVNSYRQFDVGANGAILNNAQGTTATQLGGYVAGNPWLATGTARVIVNQVNSSSPSQLNGYLEVAGERAQVIVANPTGISCSGCGFINASRTTLTTGVPVVNRGSLESYRVSGGAITIGGAGMDSSTSDYTDIIARAVKVHAGLWAQHLRVSTGTHTVSADHSQFSPGVAPSGARPVVAIDVAQLGGMYAGHIFLIANELGVGVNNAGIIASAGPLVLSASGFLSNSGSINASDTLNVASSGALTNSGTIGANHGVSLGADSVSNRGQLISTQGSLSISTAGQLSNQSRIEAAQSISLSGGGIINEGGAIKAGNTLRIATSGAVDNHGGLLLAGRWLSLRARALSGNGQILSLKDLGINVVDSLRQGGQIMASGNATIRTGGSFTNTGTTGAGGSLGVTAGTLDNQASGKLVGGSLTLKATDAHTFTNRGLIDGGNVAIDSNVANNLGTGRIYGDTISIGADVLNNGAETVNGITTAAVIAARIRLDLGVGVLNNSEHALIYSVGDLFIAGALDATRQAYGTAREINNGSATLHADGNLSIAANTINNTNNHLATADQTRPGNRIITYRLNGSSNLIDSSAAWLFNRGSGQVLNPGNWRDMGDEDNYRLLLPSASYPAERYGPPFDYSRGARGDQAVAMAYTPAYSSGGGGDSEVVSYPEIINYGIGDRIWSVMGVAPPAVDPGPGPGSEPRPGEACYESCYPVPVAPAVYAAWKSAYDTWRPKRDVYIAALQALNDKITAFNDNVNSRSYREWTLYDGTEQITRTAVTRSDPGMITSGGNMRLNAGVVNNTASQIIAGGTVAGDSVNGTAINNNGPLGRQTVVSTGSASYTYVRSHAFSADDRRYDDAPYQSQTRITQFQLDITPTDGSGPARSNSVKAVAAAVGNATGQTGSALQIRTANLPLRLPNNALYRVNTAASANYLVESDPQFTHYRNWLSSDFMLTQLQSTPSAAAKAKRLGDGFYEQQLVLRQIQQATGQRYLAGYSSNEAQYMALMNAGVQVSQAFQLTVGVALSEAQMAQLTSDIVWMVKQTVTLADGSTQEVLVPQVYLRSSSITVTGQGTLIAGNNVNFRGAGDLRNSGATIAAAQGVSLAANNVQNLGGRISGSTVGVSAATDINNQGGTIDARNTLVATAGRDINSASTTVATRNAVTSGTNISREASMSVSEANGTLLAAAGRDLNLKASSTSADNITLAAQRDVNLSTAHETSQEKVTWNKDNRAEVNRDNAIGSTVQGKAISVAAGRDINTQAAYVNTDGALSATAGNKLNIGTDVSSASARDQHKHSDSGGMLATRTIATDDSSSQRINRGSTFSGNTVVARAGNDINVTGSNVVSTQGTALAAGNKVNVVAAVDSNTQKNTRQETTSGVMGAGFGVTVGTREQSHDGTTEGQTASASTIGSTDGNVSISAGNRYTQVGSDVMAPKGDIDIAAKSVEIKAAEQASKTTTEDKYKQSGLTVAVTSPVISAIQTVDQMTDAASKIKDGRMKALAAATAGMSVHSAVGDIQKGAAEGSASIGISATLGSSQNSSRSEQNTLTQRGSMVASGGNMGIRATGDGANSNITIAGSEINAKGNLALKADKDINLIAAQNTDTQNSTRSSSSWGIGIAAQIGAKTSFGITANAAGSRGNSDGKDVSNVLTHVKAGGQVNIDSGRDTNLIGATVAGEQVVANIGRDLNIASVQDTSSFKSRDQGIGGSATIGYGAGASISASRSRVDADYASVGEQAGINAGNGGFQIKVKGNTDLKGGKIASTDLAVEQGKNSLSTGTLSVSDIQNRSQYSAENQSVSAGTSSGKPGGGIGIGSTSGNETSVTGSGVSGGAVAITDAQAQQARTEQSADQAAASLDTSVRTGKDNSNSLAKNWDGNQLREDVEAQAKITQAFGQQAAKMVGSYADAKEKELRQAASTAAQNGDQTQADQLNADADHWKEGGAYRAGAHAAVGLLAGGVSGALGAAASSALMPDIAEQIKKLGLPAAVESAVSLATASAIGTAVGGGAGAASAYNVDLNNRQLSQGQRDFAKADAKKFAQYYFEKTGQVIDEKYAEQILLGDGYRLVDAAANKGPGILGPAGDAVAVSYIALNAGDLFKVTPAEYNNPGPLGGPLKPEQAALPAATGNPALGLGTAAVLTGGIGFAGIGTQAIVGGVVDAWTAYRAANAAYWMGTALGTGATVGGASYTGSAAIGAWIDQKFGSGQAFSAGFDQRFSYLGLTAATTVGGLTGMYNTAMFGWAGVPNSFGNWLTVPGAIVRINSTAMGQAGGRAAQAAANSNSKQYGERQWITDYWRESYTEYLEACSARQFRSGWRAISIGQSFSSPPWGHRQVISWWEFK